MAITTKTLAALVAGINLKLAREEKPLLELTAGTLGHDPYPYRIGCTFDAHGNRRELSDWLTLRECHSWLRGFLAASLYNT